MFWSRISTDISELLSKCSICLERRKSNPKELFKPHDVTNYPFQKVGMDLFQMENSKYIVVVDYYSRYSEVQKLANMKSVTVNTTKNIFAQHGIPEIACRKIRYSSREFATFSHE